MKYLLALLIVFCNTAFAQVPVLLYHRISDNFIPGDTVVSPARFKEHIQTIKALGYTTVTVSQVARALEGKITLPPKSVAITFDDGWKDNLIAAKELSSAGMTGTFYFLSGMYDDQHLSKREMQEMAGYQFEIGIHSHTHFLHYADDLKKLDVATMVGEVFMSKQIIEDVIGRPVSSIAWPFGYHTAETLEYAAKLGLTSSATLINWNGPDRRVIEYVQTPMDIRRLTVSGACGVEELTSMLETGALNLCR